jgi:hypothetical protein
VPKSRKAWAYSFSLPIRLLDTLLNALNAEINSPHLQCSLGIGGDEPSGSDTGEAVNFEIDMGGGRSGDGCEGGLMSVSNGWLLEAWAQKRLCSSLYTSK